MVALYKLVLQSSDSNATGREATVGALQNITAGDTRVSPCTSQATVSLRLAANDACVIVAPLSKWASVLSGVVLEQERMLPILLDLLDTNSDMVLRPLTGLLRNLARHCSNKDHMGRWPSSSGGPTPSFQAPNRRTDARVLCLGSYECREGFGVQAAQRWSSDNAIL